MLTEAQRTHRAALWQDWYASHREERAAYRQTWNAANRERVNEYERGRDQSDVQVRLAKRLRNRLYGIVKRSRAGSAVRDLGCSISELKAHLEVMFQPGMTWENYGEWHIDHIKPLASFDLADREQFLQACRYTNLQPLWAEENLKKGARHVG